MEVLEMTLSDLDEISDVLESDFDDFWNANILKSELESELTKYFVAKESNEIVGFAGIMVLPDTCEITNIVVKKDKRNQGIGKILLNKLVEESKRLEKENISLEVSEENNIAINLYEGLGFERVGLRKKYYHGKYDAYIMTKII